MDWMYANCSTTAQRGALDWWKRFRDATKPVFKSYIPKLLKEMRRNVLLTLTAKIITERN